MSFFSKVFGGIAKAVGSVVSSVLGIKSQVSAPPPQQAKITLPDAPPPPPMADIKQQRKAEQAVMDQEDRSVLKRRSRKSLTIKNAIGTPGFD